MTRQEIAAELDRIACEWRVPLTELRGQSKGAGRQCGAVASAARMTFIKRMHQLGVVSGHIAWALNISDRQVRRFMQAMREREEAWWT